MPEQQLHLLPAAMPLLDRFGAAYFKSVPQSPGVYIMGGDRDRVLYIGQSGNLRRRLASYKNARPDRAPRKIIRLVHQVRTLVWECCDTAEDARVREVQLLRLHRPRFNVQGTWPRSCRFISIKSNDNRLDISIGFNPAPSTTAFGPFKSGAVPARSSLLRLLWSSIHRPASPHDFPTRLMSAKPPADFSFDLCGGTSEFTASGLFGLVGEYLDGTNLRLVEVLASCVPSPSELSAFQRNLIEADLATLKIFGERGPQRNRRLCEQHGVPQAGLTAEILHDLLAFDGPLQSKSEVVTLPPANPALSAAPTSCR